MGAPLRVGIVGTGRWAEQMYLPGLRDHPGARLAAICGRDRERAESVASRFAIPRVFADYREMIDRGGLQALVVATPDDLHHPIVMRALAAGLHVLCEKPLASTAAQALEMHAAAMTAGVQNMVMFNWRLQPHFRFLRALISEGYVGRCFHARFAFLGGFGRAGQYLWRFDARRANGIVGDLGSHMIDFARWYVGDIAQVGAHLATFVARPGSEGQPPDPANDSAMLTLEFANGAHGSIQVSAVAHAADRWVEQHLALHGEDGTLEVDVALRGAEGGAVIRGSRRGEDRFAILPVPETYLMEETVAPRLFIDAVVEGRPAYPDFLDGYKVQQVIDAALESHRTARRVRLA